jgi:hypothetical protein
MNIELKKASSNIMKQILKSFYEVDIDTIEKYFNNKIIDYQLTPAEIMNICLNNVYSLQNTINKIIERQN